MRIIDGKVYNTATAEPVCRIGNPHHEERDRRESTWLYRTAKGALFIAGEGGAYSRWARIEGNARMIGSGLRLVDDNEARQLVEQYGTAADHARLFGEPEQG